MGQKTAPGTSVFRGERKNRITVIRPHKIVEHMQEKIRQITESLLADYKKGRYIDRPDTFQQPDQEAVEDILEKLPAAEKQRSEERCCICTNPRPARYTLTDGRLRVRISANSARICRLFSRIRILR